MSVDQWFAQPDRPYGTAILLPGRSLGIATPLLHWPATLLTQLGWSVLGVTWDQDDVSPEAVQHCAEAALERAFDDQPVLVVAKSLGTLALPWAVENGVPGAWLTPLLQEAAVIAAVREAQQPTLLVGGTADPYWAPPSATGPGVTALEIPDAGHGLQRHGDWQRSMLDQIEIFERVGQLAEQVRAAHDQGPAGVVR